MTVLTFPSRVDDLVWIETTLDTVDDEGPEEATVLRRADGVGLLYPGRTHIVAGPPGSGKSWLATEATAQEIKQGHSVVYFDFEDRPAQLRHRLACLGVNEPELLRLVVHCQLNTSMVADDAPDPSTLLPPDCSLVVIDAMTGALTFHGLDPNGATDVDRLLARFANRLARLDAAVLIIDHVPKGHGETPSGSERKMSGITGVAYTMDGKGFRRDGTGVAHVSVIGGKDRPGFVLGHALGQRAAEFRITSSGNETQAVLCAPGGSATGRADLKGRIVDYLEEYGPSTRTAIRDGVRGRSGDTLRALDEMVDEGSVWISGAGRRQQYVLTTPNNEEHHHA